MRPLLAGLLLSLAVPAASQSIEVTPFAGYRFGGSFGTTNGDGPVEIKESAAFGISIGVTVSEEGELEASFSRQGTRLAADGFFTSAPLFDVAVETYHLNGNYLFADEKARFRPFLGVGLGITRLVPDPDELESETRFSASVVGGVKAQLGLHFGLRAEIRGLFTVLDSSSDVFCGSFSGCLVHVQGSELSQGELRGGVIFRF